MIGDFKFNLLCTPAKVYFAIAVIASIIALFNGVHLMAVFMKLVFAFVWTFLLGMLCRKGLKTLAWFLVALPYIILLLAMFGIYHATKERQLMRTVQMQGAYGQEAFGGREGAANMGPVDHSCPQGRVWDTKADQCIDKPKK